ncbi:MAG: hypothetical protein JWL86_3879 [Rhizobium sp.]|nr:hypothetical protein [Rhizobium sp.]
MGEVVSKLTISVGLLSRHIRVSGIDLLMRPAGRDEWLTGGTHP